MIKKIIFSALNLGLLFLGSSFAQEGSDEEMQKAWTEFLTPGDMHELLAKAEGKWKTKTTWWMEPGAEPQVSEGTAEMGMMLGGRYLKSSYEGIIMGMPMQGLSIEGYDNAKEKFVIYWIDNMGTGFAYAEGVYDADKNMIVYDGKMTNPMTGGDINYKQTVEFIDENKSVFSMYMHNEGQEFKSMVIESTR